MENEGKSERKLSVISIIFIVLYNIVDIILPFLGLYLCYLKDINWVLYLSTVIIIFNAFFIKSHKTDWLFLVFTVIYLIDVKSISLFCTFWCIYDIVYLILGFLFIAFKSIIFQFQKGKSSKMICPYCNFKNSSKREYCFMCGKQLKNVNGKDN